MAGVQCKFVVLVFKQRLVSWDSVALRKPATAYALTLIVIVLRGHEYLTTVRFSATADLF